MAYVGVVCFLHCRPINQEDLIKCYVRIDFNSDLWFAHFFLFYFFSKKFPKLSELAFVCALEDSMKA